SPGSCRRSRALFVQRHQLGRRRSSAWSIYRPCRDLSAVEPRGRRGPTLRQGRGGRHQARLQGPCRDGDRARLRKPLGAYAAAKVTVATANKKFGFLFPIEARDARQIIGGTASLSFKARKGGSNATLG